ncbi:MAG: hypothetical protein ACOX6N_00220 [Patescibacteria group bacterium]
MTTEILRRGLPRQKAVDALRQPGMHIEVIDETSQCDLCSYLQTCQETGITPDLSECLVIRQNGQSRASSTQPIYT